ncbi:GATA zinc finger domain-containing protein 14 isoform X2 [Papilio machaon]|uniref:GATA zinc finger domain-containing protein 14 isoform X2 n=1 Tax=Papilio machaon TaxID=76193 RepID=UPI001E665729|nr:GATA zinc finger domain-containing protein 14 isoform X2 [Papilio machaon]XP_045537851.1 GATA zinc finger domain-containing protein 14 isoform X2 [Papilio machaon]
MKVHGMRAYIEPTPVPKMPAGLVELMEGLSREVLKNNPSEVYKFCAQHMRNLLVLRDGKPPKKYLTLEQKINKANNIINQRAEERRRNFDKNMQINVDQDNIEQSRGNDIEIATIVINADNLNTSKEDSESREENQYHSEHNIEKGNSDLENGTNIVDNGHNKTDESVVKKDNTEIKTNLSNDNGNGNNPIFETSADPLDISHIVNQGNNIGIVNDDKINIAQTEMTVGDKSDKQLSINSEDNCNKTVQKLDVKIDNEVNLDHVDTNIKIDEVPNVVCELRTHEINVKEEKENKLDDDSEDTRKETELNNTNDTHDASKQNCNDSGENIEENIVVTIRDSLKDDIKDINFQVKYIDMVDISTHNEKDDGTNEAIETNPETEAVNNNLEKEDMLNKKTIEGTESVSQNKAEKVENVCEINNYNHTEETDTKIIIIEAGDNVAENENLKQDIETTNELINKTLDCKSDDTILKVALVSEHKIDEMSNTVDTQINNDERKDHCDLNKFIKDEDESDNIILIEKETQKEDNKNHANSNHDSSQLSIKDSDDLQSKNINEPETNKLNSSKTMDLETAAITIQKVFRNFLFRSKTSSFEEPTNVEFNMFGREPDAKDESGFPIHNQNKDRRVMGISRMDTVLQTVNEEKSLSLSTDDSSTISSAATVIQAHIRGFLCRNRLNRNKITSSASLNTSKESSPVSSEADPDLVKNKTVLNIHIVPEGGQFVSRDESILTSMELSLDGSPPTSGNLHPLGYDKSERRKQLKREDAIQSISPPSNNSRLSEELDSVKEVIVNEVEIGKTEEVDFEKPINCEPVSDQQEQIKNVLNSNDKIEGINSVAAVESADSPITISNNDPLLKNESLKKHSIEEKFKENNGFEEDKTEIEKNMAITIPEDSQRNIPIYNKESNDTGESVKDENGAEQDSIKKVLDGKEKTQQKLEPERNVDSQKNVATTHDDVLKNNAEDKAVTEISSDELDVVTPFTPTEEKLNDSDKPKLLHSGEFHDVVLPTKVSRNETSVVSGE